jgi:hypothetical protein
MKHSWVAAAIAFVVLLLASARTPFAGVVMGETSTARASDGETFSEQKTIYVQGNKQKIEQEGLATITDLDEGVIYVVDKNDRAYSEIPLQELSAVQPGDIQSETIQLNKTGEAKVIANHSCNEYRAVEGNNRERVIISACVSTSAPGAKEVSEFDRKMVARLTGRKSERFADSNATSLMLEKQSVLSFRIRDASRSTAHRTVTLLARTRVNNIQLKPLPPETFTPPKGYSKLRNGPRKTAPPDFPEAPDENTEPVQALPRLS